MADHRLAHRGHRRLQRWHQVTGGHLELVVVGAEGLRHQVGVDELVALPAADGVEADGEGGQPGAGLALAGQQRHHQAGVQAAGEQHAHRHVGDHPAAYRGGQRLQQGVLPVAGRPVGARRVPGEGRVPVDPLVGAAVRLVDPDGGRGELGDAPQDGARRRHDAVEAEVVRQRHRVDGGVDPATGQQGGQGAGEPHHARRLGQVERLDAEPVPGQHQPAGVPLGDRDGEHADQVVDEVEPPLGVRLDHHLAVAGGEEAVPLGLQLLAQLAVVVDAAVEHAGEPGGRVDDRLPAGGGEVDDLQAAVPEGGGAL